MQCHIGHLNTNAGWGGGEYQVLQLNSGLVSRGFASTLFAHPEGRLLDRARESGLPAELLDRGFGRLLVRDAIAGKGIGLLHAHDSRALALGISAARALRIPLVLSRRVASPVRRNPVSLWKYSARNIQAVIAMSETVREVFLRSGYPTERIHVAPSGVDVAALRRVPAAADVRARARGQWRVAGVGRLSRKKNWELLVRVAAHMAQRTDMDIHWVVAGDGPLRGRLESLARRLGVADRIHFLGFREDGAGVLKACDLLFFPSLAEGASVTVREAMVLGVPVVAADTPGTAESLAGHGWLVGGRDVEGAAAQIGHVLNRPAEREAVSLSGARFAEDAYSVDRMVEGSIRVYEQVLGEVSRE